MSISIGVSDVLSILAIIVSIASAMFQWYFDKRMNKINLESEYFSSLYLEHLLHKLPMARNRLNFSNNRLIDFDALVDELNLIRRDSLYFKYVDTDFYSRAKFKLQSLEDYLINLSEKKLNSNEQKEAFKQIEVMLESIYKIFSDKYIGN